MGKLSLAVLMSVSALNVHANAITLAISGPDTGTITLTESGNNTLITAISGTFDGATIGSLIGAGGIGLNDNLFFSSDPYVDNNGVSFSLTSPDSLGFIDVNLFAYPPGGYYETLQDNSPTSNAGAKGTTGDTLTVLSGVPEPSTICLSLTGLVGLLVCGAGELFSRFHRSVPASKDIG